MSSSRRGRSGARLAVFGGADALLPVLVKIEPGEALPTYLQRVAAVLGWPLGAVLRRVGLLDERNRAPVQGFGLAMSAPRLARLALAVRQPQDAVARTLLASLDGIALELSAVVGRSGCRTERALRRQWVLAGGSFLCPDCVREDGYWRLRWRLGWSAVCLRHSRLLVYGCPACGRPVGESRFDRNKLQPLFDLRSEQGVCGCRRLLRGRLADSPCLQALDAITSPTLAASDRAVRAQAVLDCALDGQVVVVGDRQMRPLEFLSELRSLAGLVLFAGTVDLVGAAPPELIEAFQAHVNRRPASALAAGRARRRCGVHIGMPREPALLAAVIPAALELLRLDSGELRDALVPLAAAARGRSRDYAAAIPASFAFPDRLREVWEAIETAHWQTSGRARFGHAAVGGDRLVPQLFWLELYRPRLERLLAGIDEPLGRRYCAMALLRELTGFGWNEAGLALGGGAVRGAALAATVAATLDAEHVSLLDALIRTAGDELRRASRPIDYGARRSRFAALREISWHRWRRLVRDAGVSLRDSAPDARRWAAAWLWAELTGGDACQSPALRDHDARTRQQYLDFLGIELPRLEQPLRALAAQLLFESELLGDETWLVGAARAIEARTRSSECLSQVRRTN